MPIPPEAYDVAVAFLPPMSGLTSNETLLTPGAIQVRLGEGRTAEVLRNICYQVYSDSEGSEWEDLKLRIRELFGVTLGRPEYFVERGEIQMSYKDPSNLVLDLSSAGRGLQQTLLLLAYLALHPKSVLLLDEPDAHLEILRQRDIYQQLSETARKHGSQVIIASHSEAVLNEAYESADDAVVAFLGKPHLIPQERKTEIRRSLDRVRHDQYYLAEQRGWVLYLEDRTDLEILRAFARRVGDPLAERALHSPFLFTIGNQPNKGREHFACLLEAKPDLVGFLLVDRDAKELQSREALVERKWRRREIENYICQPETLEAFARALASEYSGGPLFESGSSQSFAEAMQESIIDRLAPAVLKNRQDVWWSEAKASDQFLDLVFPEFYRKIGYRLDFRKADYHRLVPFIQASDIDGEVLDVLHDISEVARRANPLEGEG
jgi:hypothetical protein